MINALNAQVAYLARHSSRFYFPKITLILHIMVWVIAMVCAGLLVAVVYFALEKPKPFAVTQAGLVVPISAIDDRVMRKLLDQADGAINIVSEKQ